MGDFQGHPFRGNQHTKLYHGTTKRAADQIRRQGLIPERHTVYLTDNPERAADYAKRSAHLGEPTEVIEVHVPNSEMKRLGKTSSRNQTIFSYAGQIPKEWIAYHEETS